MGGAGRVEGRSRAETPTIPEAPTCPCAQLWLPQNSRFPSGGASPTCFWLPGMELGAEPQGLHPASFPLPPEADRPDAGAYVGGSSPRCINRNCCVT